MAEYGAYNTDWAAGVQAAANILGSTAQMIYQGEADSENRYLYRQTRDMQRQWALEDYEKVLRDSSPSEQVRRLKEAGLNPNLVYGSGNIQTGVTSAPAMNMPTPPYKQRGLDLDLSAINAIGYLLDTKLKQAEINKVNAEAEKTKSETTGQDLQNQFNEDTLSLREAMLSNENYKILRETSKIDNDILNDSLITQKNLQISDEQIKTLIQSRQVQWEELELSKKQIGANIRQGFMTANAAIMQGRAAQNNAYANMIRATSESLRNSKLNELTDKQIGTMALENLRLQNDMQYDPDRHELESQKREAIYKRNEAWNRNFSWTGISFDDFRSLIPFTPSVEGSHISPVTGDKVKWKF